MIEPQFGSVTIDYYLSNMSILLIMFYIQGKESERVRKAVVTPSVH